MKLYILTLTKETQHYDYDLEDWISDYEDVCIGAFDNKTKAESIAKEYLEGRCPFDVNVFCITECELNNITEMGKEYIY